MVLSQRLGDAMLERRGVQLLGGCDTVTDDCRCQAASDASQQRRPRTIQRREIGLNTKCRDAFTSGLTQQKAKPCPDVRRCAGGTKCLLDPAQHLVGKSNRRLGARATEIEVDRYEHTAGAKIT